MIFEKISSGWNVLRTRSRHEKVVEKYLEQKQIEVYLPKVCKTSERKEAATRLGRPLFPGYVFVKPQPNQIYGLNFIPGSCGMILERNRPGIVYESEIMAIRAVLAADFPLDLHPGLIVGVKVKVMAGPLAGIEGELVRLRDTQRLVINAKILGQAVSVEINHQHLVPL